MKTCSDCTRYHDGSCEYRRVSKMICKDFNPMCYVCKYRRVNRCTLFDKPVKKYIESCDEHIYRNRPCG